MDLSTRKYISELAQRIINTYNIEVPISNIEDIVHTLGGKIEIKADFDDLYDGTICKSGENGFVIALPSYKNEQRKTFAIAHELGHLFLHMGFMTDKELWKKQPQETYISFRTSEQEYQANEFANSLLMPKELYKQVLKDNIKENSVNVLLIAKSFNVPISAAVSRGQSLGYL